MDPSRPSLGVARCAICGADVDALRAPRAVLLGTEPAPLCSEACFVRFTQGERPRPSRVAAHTESEPRAPRRPAQRLGDVHLPIAPYVLSGLALLLSPFAERAAISLVVTIAITASSAALALHAARLGPPRLAIALASVGVCVVALDAHLRLEALGFLGQVGASIASLAVISRLALWSLHQEPLDREASVLEERLAQKLGHERAGDILASLRADSPHEPALSTRVARVSAYVGAALTLALVGLTVVMPRGASTLSVVGAALLSLPLLAPLVVTARAYLRVGLHAAARGVFFDGTRAMERLGQATHAIFPTHGTLTRRRAELVGVHRVGDEPMREEELLGLLASTEAAAGAHPLARAAREACEARGIAPPVMRRARALEGRGVTSLSAEGESVIVGHRALLLAEGVSVARADGLAGAIEAAGDTAVFLAVAERVRCVFAFRYIIRDGAREAIEQLHTLRVDTSVLSGDHHASVEALAARLDIPHVRAELLPSEKLVELEKMQESGEPFVVVEHAEASTSLLPAARLAIRLKDDGARSGHGASVEGEDLRLASATLALAKRLRLQMITSGLVLAALGLPTLILAAFFDLAPAVAAVVALFAEAFAHPTGKRAIDAERPFPQSPPLR